MEAVDVTALAQAIVACVSAVHSRGLTEALLVKVLLGSQDKEVRARALGEAGADVWAAAGRCAARAC